MSSIHTEFEFALPRGYLDAEGNLHREGVMRLATAADEILPLKDPRVQSNPAYLVVILLSRVITRLGSLEAINPKVIEGLFAADLAYLQEFYNRINRNGKTALRLVCPHCQQAFEAEPEPPGES
ncbi:MAG: phage tail assembly protein [Acidobacteriia bacterium]|nr:phage tail assembly protein [Terriglobia bacterium]